MSDAGKISLMLVDDHFVVRSGLAVSLDLEPDIEVIAEAESGAEAIEKFQRLKPSVVLMDLELPDFSGIETTKEILAEDSEARILIFSTFQREDEVTSALDAGAIGYLQKSSGRDELIEAIRTVATGKRYLSPGLSEQISDLQNISSVTPREREILERIAKGKANKEIGAELGISEDTVKRHVSNVLQKLNVSDRAQATAEAIRRGILQV
ncbi:MAG: response regulator transcription factor [Verrucomicrobiales bacterium]|nr:response regulator transcription factor [Verrucomicrobiales bacterium]